MLDSIYKWCNKSRLENIEKIHRYRLYIIFKDESEIVIDTDRYYFEPKCSFSEYFLTLKEDRLYINNKFYPSDTIKSINDEIIETELIYVKEDFIALFGVTYEKLKENQRKYKRLFDLYKDINLSKGDFENELYNEI